MRKCKYSTFFLAPSALALYQCSGVAYPTRPWPNQNQSSTKEPELRDLFSRLLRAPYFLQASKLRRDHAENLLCERIESTTIDLLETDCVNL